MNHFKNFILVLILGYITMSCGTTTETFWVRGTKTPCDMGAGMGDCLNVYKGKSLDVAEWQPFYNQIDGFTFQPGVAQKIEVERKELKKSEIPADGSKYTYSLKKVVETEQDLSSEINGNWVVATINGNPINRMAKLPTMNIDVDNNTVSGFDGCNNYQGPITMLTSTYLNLGVLKATQKMCVDMTVPNSFNKALSEIYAYALEGDVLSLYDDSKQIIMTMIPFKEDMSAANDMINNDWTAVRIFGNPINRMDKVPYMTISTSKKAVIGSDGCNTFSASIIKATASTLQLTNAAKTEKSCPNMTTADQFNNALLKTATYQIDGRNLVLLDSGGQEVLAFIPKTKDSK